jgi:hypothetical protein
VPCSEHPLVDDGGRGHVPFGDFLKNSEAVYHFNGQQTVTMNGFPIMEPEGTPQELDERRFIVKSPGGDEHEVLVRIDEETVGYVERMTRRQLPAGNSFWTVQAERTLNDYLEKMGGRPNPYRVNTPTADTLLVIYFQRSRAAGGRDRSESA